MRTTPFQTSSEHAYQHDTGNDQDDSEQAAGRELMDWNSEPTEPIHHQGGCHLAKYDQREGKCSAEPLDEHNADGHVGRPEESAGPDPPWRRGGGLQARPRLSLNNEDEERQ